MTTNFLGRIFCSKEFFQLHQSKGASTIVLLKRLDSVMSANNMTNFSLGKVTLELLGSRPNCKKTQKKAHGIPAC